MKFLQKKLAEQKKEHQKLDSTLDTLYKEYGEALFEDVLKNDISEEHPFFDTIQTWKNLKEARKNAADSIVTMKAALFRQKEVEQFYREAEKILRQHTKIHKQLQEQFVLLFFETYAHDDSIQCLKEMRDNTKQICDSIEKLEEQQHLLEEQRETASTVKKLLINSQLTILQQKLNHLKKSKEKKALDASAGLINKPVIQDMYDQNLFSAPLAELYLKIKDAESKKHETETRQHNLTNEKNKLAADLQEQEQTKQPKKSIAILNEQIKDIDTEMADTETKHGKNHADILYTENGTLKETDADNFNTNEELETYANNIAEKRAAFAKTAVNIAYLENLIAIQKADAVCAGLKKTITDHKKSITQYEQLIASAETNIAQTEERIKDLTKNNELLEPDASLVDEIENKA